MTLQKIWEGKEPAPIEFFHSELMKSFHEYRLSISNSTTIELDGIAFNSIVADAKRKTYKKYKKLDIGKIINSEDLL